MKRVRVGAIEMAYEEHGTGGRPFVLVHGFTGSRDDWREMLPRLAARGRTIAMDLRGHADTTNTGDAANYDFAHQIPGANLVIVEAAGHSPQLENPEAWFAAIDAHLARVRARTGAE